MQKSVDEEHVLHGDEHSSHFFPIATFPSGQFWVHSIPSKKYSSLHDKHWSTVSTQDEQWLWQGTHAIPDLIVPVGQ